MTDLQIKPPCCFHRAKLVKGRGRKENTFSLFSPHLSLSLDKNKMAAIILKIRPLEFACTANYKLTVIIALKSLVDQLELNADRF